MSSLYIGRLPIRRVPNMFFTVRMHIFRSLLFSCIQWMFFRVEQQSITSAVSVKVTVRKLLNLPPDSKVNIIVISCVVGSGWSLGVVIYIPTSCPNVCFYSLRGIKWPNVSWILNTEQVKLPNCAAPIFFFPLNS